jgi:hypothetical protein
MQELKFTIYGKKSNPDGYLAVKNFMTILLKVTSEIYHICILRWWNSTKSYALPETYDFKKDSSKVLTKATINSFTNDFMNNVIGYTSPDNLEITPFTQFFNHSTTQDYVLNSLLHHTELLGIEVIQAEDGAITDIKDPEVSEMQKQDACRERILKEEAEARRNKTFVPKKIAAYPSWNPTRERRRGTEQAFGIKPKEYNLPSGVSFKYRPATIPTRMEDLLKKNLEMKEKTKEVEEEEES